MSGYHEISTLRVGDGEAFASLGDAFHFIRELRAAGIGQPVTVQMAAGEYCLTETLVIDGKLSGVTVEPRGNDRVRLIGGYRVTGFERDIFNGVPCLSAPVPDIDFTDFYVNGKRAALTRYPETGTLEPEGADDPDRELVWDRGSFMAREGDIRPFRNFERIQLSFCHLWIDEHTPIESYDPETRMVRLKYPSTFELSNSKKPGQDFLYYLENVAEAFGRPDDWYAENGRVYYVPRDESITAETIEAYVPTIPKLIEFRGTADEPVSRIRLRGLTLGVTRGEYVSRQYGGEQASDSQAVAGADGSVTFRYAANCSLEDCELADFGVHGIVIGEGSRGIRISRCRIHDGGAGGVKIIGSADEQSPEATDHNTVEDCSILWCGRRYYAACGILMMHTGNNVIAHNEIGHLGYTGVSCGWIWGYRDSPTHDNLIMKNHIHHCGEGLLSDMGGVYLLGPQRGTVVSGNVVHDILSAEYGGWGLYTDEGSSYITLENNISYNTSNNSFHQHYGMMNTVRNNIFAFSKDQVLRVNREEAHLSTLFDTNIVYSDGTPSFDLRDKHIRYRTVSSKNNLFWDASGRAPVLRHTADTDMTLEDLRSCGIDEGSMTADPQFRDAANYDFTLEKTSPALALGFRPIDTSDVGPRN